MLIKHHYLVAKDKGCKCKTWYQNNFCSWRKSNKLCNSKCHNSLSCENKQHSCRDTPWCFYVFFGFSFLTNWCNEKYILVVFCKGKTSVYNGIGFYPFFLPFSLCIWIFPIQNWRFYIFPKKKQSLYTCSA